MALVEVSDADFEALKAKATAQGITLEEWFHKLAEEPSAGGQPRGPFFSSMFITNAGKPTNPVVDVNEEGRPIVRIDPRFAGEVWIYLIEGPLEQCRAAAQQTMERVRGIAEFCLEKQFRGAEAVYKVEWVMAGEEPPSEPPGIYADVKEPDDMRVIGWLENGTVAEVRAVPKQPGRFGRFVGVRLGCRVGYLYQDEFEEHVQVVIDAARMFGNILAEPLLQMGFTEQHAFLLFRSRLFHPNSVRKDIRPGA